MRGSTVAVSGALLLLLAAPAGGAEINPHNTGACTACHGETPKFGIDTRRTVTFTTAADDPGLCVPCHPAGTELHPILVETGSGPPDARKSTYLPAGSSAAVAGKIVCTSCHFIHASDGRFALLRGFPGSPDPRYFASIAEFCGECHGRNLEKRSPHGGGERYCGYCHGVKPREGAKQATTGLMTPERCSLCHRGQWEQHYAKMNPFPERQGCLGCHDPHANTGDAPGLLGESYRAAAADSVTVRPHYQRGLCFTCHANLDDYALRNEDVNALCDRCHASGKIAANIHPIRKVPAGITVPKGWPLADGALTCLTCHEQGHEDQQPAKHMLRGGPYAGPRDICRGCHPPSAMLGAALHKEINDGKHCEYCHKTRPVPGKDTSATVTLIADPDLLCLRCHDSATEDGDQHHILLWRKEMHAEHVPEGLPVFQGQVICATCHNPHQREAEGHRLRAWLAETEFCTNCHQQ